MTNTKVKAMIAKTDRFHAAVQVALETIEREGFTKPYDKSLCIKRALRDAGFTFVLRGV